MHQTVGNLSLLTGQLLLFQRIDQIDRREETHPPVGMHDRLHTDGRRQMRLARAGSANQHHVVG